MHMAPRGFMGSSMHGGSDEHQKTGSHGNRFLQMILQIVLQMFLQVLPASILSIICMKQL